MEMIKSFGIYFNGCAKSHRIGEKMGSTGNMKSVAKIMDIIEMNIRIFRYSREIINGRWNVLQN